jgi:hypothetical protein
MEHGQRKDLWNTAKSDIDQSKTAVPLIVR